VLTIRDGTVQDFDIEDELFSLSPFPYMGNFLAPRLTATAAALISR